MASSNKQSMNTSNVLSIIMGGGQGKRLFPLTKERAKPAVPLAGKYRLVDIPISNCINSGLRRIYLLPPLFCPKHLPTRALFRPVRICGW